MTCGAKVMRSRAYEYVSRSCEKATAEPHAKPAQHKLSCKRILMAPYTFNDWYLKTLEAVVAAVELRDQRHREVHRSKFYTACV
jgi:hypothetical protein